MLEACLIGLTGYAQRHLEWIKTAQHQGRVHLQCMTILPEQQETEAEAISELKNEGVKIYSQVSTMFEEEKGNLQLCFLPTSISSHKSLTIQALEAGCHVLVEKPVAGSSEEVNEMIEARDRYGRYVVVGFQDIARRDVHLIKSGLQEGTWGNLQSINFTAIWPRHHHYFHRNNWVGKLQLNGTTTNDSPANNATAHFLNTGLFISGDQANASAEVLCVDGNLYRSRQIESFDTMSVNFHLDTGINFRYTVSHSSTEKMNEDLNFHTDEGVLTIANRGTFWKPHGEDSQNLTVDNTQAGRDNMVSSFLDYVERGESQWPHCNLELARTHVKAIETLHDQLPILSLSDEVLTNQDDTVSILGIDHAISRARDEVLTFKEMGISFPTKDA
jgi:predicted dehydrogenase